MGSVEESFDLIKGDVSKTLGITVGKHKITTPGQYIPKPDAQATPELSFNVSTGTYIVIGLDLDAPFASLNFLSPILHWIQSGLTPTPEGKGTSTLSAGNTPFVVDWAAVGAPGGPCAPHRYVFLLYEQPDDFDVQKHTPNGGAPVGLLKRTKFDLGAFEKEVKLGPVIAFNYFTSN
ncbi:hypothetical protein LCER1_G001656 [Lachnellula cervina]|uniref:Carboxypeptidase Y inhibitor n=1 Tax=Lachnellula cervina TaxID=1316786 RepID=A0A7D8Z4G0_9HELO|nr:hypothetical protein LCER1_G001656 [Lachnellula cervina]